MMRFKKTVCVCDLTCSIRRARHRLDDKICPTVTLVGENQCRENRLRVALIAKRQAVLKGFENSRHSLAPSRRCGELGASGAICGIHRR
jgi:hypothetical protein